MNIGLGMAITIIAIFLILLFTFLRKNFNKVLSYGLLVIGIIFLVFSVLLLAGIYGPYANHIR